jgi:D-alanyl-lipoteichoic acid acyltransferase DltB (MBOAT superfamily)
MVKVDVRSTGAIRDHAQTSETVDVWALTLLLGPLVAVWVVIDHFGIESKAFSQLALITFAGFAVHYFLPLRYRVPFVACLSIFAIGVVLGVSGAAWTVGIGMALIGLCHLPVSLRARTVLLVVAGIVLGSLRANLVTSPVPAFVWPILGSMFMFRLAVYLYDTSHEPSLASFWSSVSYFFLLPNVCFPLFPVVDYKAFRKNYGIEERHKGYAIGVRWIYRGVIQLILYRLVYQTLVIDAAKVENVADLAQYLIWPFLLYLRVSGQFHIVIGMLRLFGFDLPETHHAYFLMSSFTDFWRRINIYWKDFMMKLFYYPAYFALRKRGPTLALVASTCLVFGATWLLHSYQWFWLRGAFQFSWNDTLFWTILGVLVVINALREWRRGRARSLAPRVLGWGPTLALAARTVGMFLVICLLWSLWSTESLATWLSLWSAARQWPVSPSWTSIASLCVPIGVALAVIAKERGWGLRHPLSDERRSVLLIATAGILVLSTSWRVMPYLGPASATMLSLRFGGLNQADAVALERGYYENLMAVDRFNGELWSLYTHRPPDWAGGLADLGLSRPTQGFVSFELVPSHEGRFKGATFRTDRWGLYDKEYDKTPPPGCQRIAVLGASHAMGTGVERENTFEAVLEARLNREHPERCYEILNFGVHGYGALQQLAVLQTKVLEFQPNTILYVGHPEDSQRVVYFMTQQVRHSNVIPFDYLSQIVKEAGVTSDMPERIVSQRLAPFGERLLAGLYREINDLTTARGICAGFVFLPMVPDMKYAVDVEREKQLATNAGFALLDLSGVYDVPGRQSLWVAEWDAHPNKEGHRLIADRLYTLLSTGEQRLLECPGR